MVHYSFASELIRQKVGEDYFDVGYKTKGEYRKPKRLPTNSKKVPTTLIVILSKEIDKNK